MTDAFQPNLDFTAAEQVDAREAFVVDLDGYEGPLHVLLALARTQKVDLLNWPLCMRRGGGISRWRRTIS